MDSPQALEFFLAQTCKRTYNSLSARDKSMLIISSSAFEMKDLNLGMFLGWKQAVTKQLFVCCSKDIAESKKFG